MLHDPYYKKQIEYVFQRKNFKFDVANENFSSYKIDIGTDLLLDTMLRSKPDKKRFDKILDLGCGYGPLGIILSKYYDEAECTMVDKDLLSVRYANINSKLNDVDDRSKAFGSVGMDSLESLNNDLVVSNIPAKVGDKAIEEEFILKPIASLNSGGEYWCVVVSGLNRLLPSIATRNGLKLKQVSKRVGHTVYKYTHK